MTAHSHSQITISLHNRLVNKKETTHAYETDLLFMGTIKNAVFLQKADDLGGLFIMKQA